MKTYHLIDHPGFGTLHKLLIPVCEFSSNHTLFTPYKGLFYLDENKLFEINQSKCRIILHSSGRTDSIYLNHYSTIFPDKKIYIFMHISDEKLLIKDRHSTIGKLITFSNQGGTVLTPAREVSDQFARWGIRTQSIQMGIPHIEQDNKYSQYIDRLSPFYNKIITTCSTDDDLAKFAKGIDRFDNLMHKLGLQNQAIVAGTNNNNGINLPCHQFSSDDFINILNHSIAYVQLSRYETYNLSAVQAKRMRCPALILRAEGTPSCMSDDVCDSIEQLENQLTAIMTYGKDQETISRLFNDSCQRETVERFVDDLEQLDM